ncbi:MAG TPA: NAD-dependent malic enzyme [Candidatus Limnocylindrales bacterium]|nr:NAD-dependent malic enzyme [Candidatus Limnocylindrales bacterium]
MTASPLHVSLRGMHLLDTPLYNKGTAFTEEERTAFGLHGLLPPQIETLDEQAARAYEAYRRKADDLERHIYLRALQDNNETLFYRLIHDHIEELMPVVYTPVVALGCQHFSQIYRRPRGLFISYPLRDCIPELLRSRPNPEVDIIVVTDGERILGIGDQGVGGMGIPIGKLSLYSLIGGIHPARTLPVVLDVGTNNQDRLKTPEYLGWRHERICGDAYYEFVDQFVQAVKHELPRTCLQWEDFAGSHARPLLDRYRDQLLTFNDDIQGTAAVVLGALIGAIKIAGIQPKDQQIVFYGAGAAAIGVADYLRESLVQGGLSEEEARSRFWIVNRAGVLRSDRTDLSPEQRVYAQLPERFSQWRMPPSGTLDLETVIRNVRATILIGLSTSAGSFTELIVREMASKVERPIIFPLSNPTDRSEAAPADLLRWTDGRALVATGSPFAPVEFRGRKIPVAQCNNVYIFPAVGLGLMASRAGRVTDKMMIAASRALGENSPALRDPSAPLLPALTELRRVARDIAFAVATEAQRSGTAAPSSPRELRDLIAATQWTPEYVHLVRAKP